MKELREYEAPRVRDLEELGVWGEFPLATDLCTVGTGELGHVCAPGTGAAKHDPCGPGTGDLP
jgi:hypothetical protein